MDAQEAVYKIVDHLLGAEYYGIETGSPSNYNDVAVASIMHYYPTKGMTPVDKWRARHKRCKWCTHCVPRTVINPIKLEFEIVYDCVAKEARSINIDIPRPFCTVFNLKKERYRE